MKALIDHGRAALFEYLRSIPKHRRPIGGGMIHVVTRESFVANCELCLSYVETTTEPLHVLCPSGSICVLIEKRG